MNDSVRGRITVFLPTLRGGGAERVMSMLSSGLAARGHTVDLVVANARGNEYASEIAANVAVHDLKARRVLFAIPALFRHLRRTQPSAILSALNHANIAAVIARQFASPRSRLILSVHNALDPGQDRPPTRPWMRVLMMRFFRAAEAVVAVSEGIREELIRSLGLPEDRVVTIYNPLDVARIAKLARAPAGHDWLDKKVLPVVIGVGRLTRQKDFASLIEAFAIVRERKPCRLVILGDGELLEDLEALVETRGLVKHVLFAGFRSNPYAWLSRSDVFVLSSRWEGLPGVLLEALATGTQVVSTDCRTGPREILEDGKWGQLTPVGDPEALADAVEHSLERVDVAEVRQRASEFDKSIAVSRYEQVLRG